MKANEQTGPNFLDNLETLAREGHAEVMRVQLATIMECEAILRSLGCQVEKEMPTHESRSIAR